MTDPVLIETYGDAVNLRILNFFVENPFDGYSVVEIARFSSVSRNSVYKYLELFVDRGYLTVDNKQNGKLFKLNRANRVIQLIDEFVEKAGSIFAGPLKPRAALPKVESICESRMPDRMPMVAVSAN